jgi:hypothetical protein
MGNLNTASMATDASAAASVRGLVLPESGCSWKTNRWNNWKKERQKRFFECGYFKSKNSEERGVLCFHVKRKKMF